MLTPFIVNKHKHETSGNNVSDKRRWLGVFASKSQTSAEARTSLSNQNDETRIVWINRGWIPRHFVDRDLKVLHQWDQPSGTVEIMTMESETDTPGRFTPPSRLEMKGNDSSNAIQKLLWLDRQAIAELTDCPSDQSPPLFVQIRDDSCDDGKHVFPARSTREYVGEFKVTPEVHAGYAVTWFGLSGAGVLMTRKLFSRGK